jgi:single-stranded DNA-binding protein
MVHLTFTGIAGRNPEVRVAENGNTIAIFPVDVKEEPYLPPTTIQVVALGKSAVYAQQVIKKDSLVMVSGWFRVELNKKGNEFLEVKARHLRALIG